jgi:hypothetical protein
MIAADMSYRSRLSPCNSFCPLRNPPSHWSLQRPDRSRNEDPPIIWHRYLQETARAINITYIEPLIFIIDHDMKQPGSKPNSCSKYRCHPHCIPFAHIRGKCFIDRSQIHNYWDRSKSRVLVSATGYQSIQSAMYLQPYEDTEDRREFPSCTWHFRNSILCSCLVWSFPNHYRNSARSLLLPVEKRYFDS